MSKLGPVVLSFRHERNRVPSGLRGMPTQDCPRCLDQRKWTPPQDAPHAAPRWARRLTLACARPHVPDSCRATSAVGAVGAVVLTEQNSFQVEAKATQSSGVGSAAACRGPESSQAPGAGRGRGHPSVSLTHASHTTRTPPHGQDRGRIPTSASPISRGDGWVAKQASTLQRGALHGPATCSSRAF